MQDRAEFQRLYTAYRQAWHCFVMEVDWWQSREAEDLAAREAPEPVEEAEVLYRQSRNRLADYLISKQSKSPANAGRFRPRVETFRGANASLEPETQPKPSYGLAAPAPHHFGSAPLTEGDIVLLPSKGVKK
jgi:hypothetical protein